MTASLGTIISVTVALSFGIYPILKTYLDRPNLMLSVRDLGSTWDGSIQNYSDYEWGIMLENKGRQTAKKITMKIKRVESMDEDRIIHYNDVPLKNNFNLAWNDYINITLIYLGPMFDDAHIISLDYGDIGFTNCIIELLITGENFRGTEIKLKYTHSENYNDTNLEIIK